MFSLPQILTTALQVLWLLLPAYTPNNFAVLLGGGKPLDLGRNFIDGKRILGDGKTVRGFVSGVAGGILTANVQFCLECYTGLKIYSSLPYSEFFVLTFLLSFGAMAGDSLGSFVKRRFGIERGGKFPVFDQLTFLFVSLLISSLYPAFWKLFDIAKIVIGILITPLLHVLTNCIAYKLNLKDVPW